MTLDGRSFEQPAAFCNPESDMQAVRAGSSARGADDDGERDGEGEGKSNTTIIVLAILISLLLLAIAVGLGGAGFHVSFFGWMRLRMASGRLPALAPRPV